MCVRCSDYRNMPELDQYEQDGIASDADVESLSQNAAHDARQAAERELERRDKREGGDLPAAFQSGALLAPFPFSTPPCIFRTTSSCRFCLIVS